MSNPEGSDGDLVLDRLDVRHPGICEALSGTICGAAAVCLMRHGEPPTEFRIVINEEWTGHRLQWMLPSQTTLRSHRNVSDATRDGAYALALLAAERRLGLVAISRAEQGTGADWYVGPPGCGISDDGEPDLEDPEIWRLEVGGRDSEPWKPVLQQKSEQIASGASDIHGIAAVVIFREAITAIQLV